MFPSHNPSSHRGSMLVIAIFVLTIMAILGLTIVKLLNSSADAVTHEVYGARAFNAARSSMDTALARAFPLTQNGDSECQSVQLTNYANVPGMEFCIGVSRCSLKDHFVGETTRYYQFVSSGICSAGDIIASRTIAVDAKVD